MKFKQDPHYMNISEMFCWILAIFFYFLAIWVFPFMPEEVATHWNALGQVDGHTGRFLATFMLPYLATIMFILFVTIPRIDPLKNNIKKFRVHFDGFIMLLMMFLLYLYLLVISWNLGQIFDMGQVLSPAFAILIYYCGILIENAKMNWFIGIRTPWTMSSELVWKKTHVLGGKLFKISGVIAVLGIFEFYAIWLVIGPVVVSSIYAVVYSYFEFQRQAKKKKRKRR